MTFSGRPDVLDLIVETGLSAEMSIQPIVSSTFGESEERVFYYRDFPLGLVHALMPYHETRGAFRDESILVVLAPALRASTPFPEVTSQSFTEALAQFLSSGSTDWTLICERDCDQDSIVHLQASTNEAENQLVELFRFIDGHPGGTCPTFVITKANKPALDNP
jgi:hypothetical protein